MEEDEPSNQKKEETAPETSTSFQRRILLHLLKHHGEQVRFEASQWTTEFGLLQSLSGADPVEVKRALHMLEESRRVLRRSQYVVGYSEPKTVYVLTPDGHRMALELQQEERDCSM